ncbi:hypothetical protein LA080_000401 [Diaporthe eres]|nr:hypothetical protein LA080_000401 [Diaporthe eres]
MRPKTCHIERSLSPSICLQDLTPKLSQLACSGAQGMQNRSSLLRAKNEAEFVRGNADNRLGLPIGSRYGHLPPALNDAVSVYVVCLGGQMLGRRPSVFGTETRLTEVE